MRSNLPYHLCTVVMSCAVLAVLAVLATAACVPNSRVFACSAPVIGNVTGASGQDDPTRKALDVHWMPDYDVLADNCTHDADAINLFVRNCSWQLSCNTTHVTNASLTFTRLTAVLSIPSTTSSSALSGEVLMNVSLYRVVPWLRTPVLMYSATQQPVATGRPFLLTMNTADDEWFYLTQHPTETAFVNVVFYTSDQQDEQLLIDQTNIAVELDMDFLCVPGQTLTREQQETITQSLVVTRSQCPMTTVVRNLTCPAPVLSNITLYNEPMVNGSYQIHKYNKSWDIEWYAEYNRSIDAVTHCGKNATNPYNYFERDCNWTLQCNIPNVTNGSVAFYNFTVDLSTPEFSAVGSVFLDLVFLRQLNDTNPPIQMFTIANVPITQVRTINATHNYAFPSATTGRLPNTPLGQGYILTSNWTEKAIVKARFYTGNTSTLTGYITDMGITLNMHLECDQFFINVTIYDDGDIGLILALALPFGLIGLILLAAGLKYLFPNMCDCCKRTNDGNDNFDDDEAILAAARAKREGRDLAQPMVDIKDKAGMQTWLDQAEDVVEDLNKNCLYLEEAKADSQMNKGFDALERGGANPTLGSHTDGFIGGRQLYAAGSVSGGVKVVDHRPTMQTKGGGDDDVVL